MESCPDHGPTISRGELDRDDRLGPWCVRDDFGTGHSSLAQIKNMPLHELKIDKSFITNLTSDEQNKAIVHTTIELAHNMNLSVVAEGIEDEQTLRQICAMGCEEAQGYFLSRPM